MFCEKWAIRFKNFLMFYGFTKDSSKKYNAFISTSLITWIKTIKYIKQNKIISRYFPHILVFICKSQGAIVTAIYFSQVICLMSCLWFSVVVAITGMESPAVCRFKSTESLRKV